MARYTRHAASGRLAYAASRMSDGEAHEPHAQAVDPPSRSKNQLRGHKTSVTLQDEFWSCAVPIARLTIGIMAPRCILRRYASHTG
ncbi:MAG: hypothetical protein V7604_3316 [Hyphomicrobiales bacterium]|jgi:hypothetical protein